MHKYDYLYIPDPKGKHDVLTDYASSSHSQKATMLKGVILLTVEELREVWAIANERGYNIGSEGHCGNNLPKDLDELLQSKGIQLPLHQRIRQLSS